MGQSNSRLQNQETQHEPSGNSALPSSVAGVSTELPADSLVDVGAEGSNPAQSRRSSVRKSILKLVTPSNIRSRINSITSNPGDVRRPWRNSRRWSKAQPEPILQHDDSLVGSSSGSYSPTAGPSNLPPCTLDKGKQREIASPSEEDEEYHNAMASTLEEAPQLSDPIPASDLGLASSLMEISPVAPTAMNSPLLSGEMTYEGAHTEYPSNYELSPVSSDTPTELSLQQEQEPLSSQPQQQPASLPRQFPPPGTLVVVQGIVHTTDVSRPNNSTSTGPATSGDATTLQSGSGLEIGADQATRRPRNRLSALLRPRSSSRPASTIINDTPSSPITNTLLEGDSPSMSGSESPTSSDESAHTAITTPNINDLGDFSREPLSTQDQSLPTPENRSTAISSSSIDVLGTLLSVAAAATAASLLTGSSEPILSSGLAPPLPGSPPHIPHHNASMPNLPSYPGPALPTAVLPDVSAAGRSERMRQAWGTIRERLGLRPSTSSTDDTRNQHHGGNDLDPVYTPPTDDGIGLTSPTDTRELMLAEMARAFNIGLGLNGLGGLAPGSNPGNGRSDGEAADGSHNSSEDTSQDSDGTDGTSHTTAQPTVETSTATLPPEGSFERFLVDLQIDLRAALTQTIDDEHTSEELSAPPQEHSQPEPQPVRSMDDIGQTVNSPVPHPSSDTPLSNGDLHSSSDQVHQNNHALPSDIPESLFYGHRDYADTAFLQDVTDSESEFDEDEHGDDDYEDDDFQSAEHNSLHDHNHAESSDAHHGHTSGTGHIDASGRINWWRLYRFPPIVSPHYDTSPLRQPSVSINPVSPISAVHTDPELPTPLASSGTIPVPFPAAIPISSQPPSQSVVPVIVVGLQSVNSEWRADLPTQADDDGVDFFGQPTSDTGVGAETGDDDDLDGWGGQHHTGLEGRGLDRPAGRGRARGWHSRAANAIRNLRPGRRNTEAGSDAQIPVAAPGSRTFLIYVIGGYYPPDHSIVTGGPNILDSFEALLELADLLGQVKPPTVSKAEIEKSGLEIIKASELPQYEQEGKVSSNCLDRCLICLDDYESKDPIRVMSCRHAFHQNCVDEWLQKGRNNCPACRSTGVSMDNHPGAPMPNSAS